MERRERWEEVREKGSEEEGGKGEGRKGGWKEV